MVLSRAKYECPLPRNTDSGYPMHHAQVEVAHEILIAEQRKNITVNRFQMLLGGLLEVWIGGK